MTLFKHLGESKREMRIAITGMIAVVLLAGSVACFWTGDDVPEETVATPDVGATIAAAVAEAVGKELERAESAPPSQTTGDDVSKESVATPDADATIAAAIAEAVGKEAGGTEAVPSSQVTVTPAISTGQANWLDGLAQFRRIKVARDEVDCVGYDNGRYTSSHTIVRVDDGFYALGNPGEAVAFYDGNSGCRIGVITDESLE